MNEVTEQEVAAFVEAGFSFAEKVASFLMAANHVVDWERVATEDFERFDQVGCIQERTIEQPLSDVDLEDLEDIFGRHVETLLDEGGNEEFPNFLTFVSDSKHESPIPAVAVAAVWGGGELDCVVPLVMVIDGDAARENDSQTMSLKRRIEQSMYAENERRGGAPLTVEPGNALGIDWNFEVARARQAQRSGRMAALGITVRMFDPERGEFGEPKLIGETD